MFILSQLGPVRLASALQTSSCTDHASLDIKSGNASQTQWRWLGRNLFH